MAFTTNPKERIQFNRGFILKMKARANDLMAAGQAISDDELILYILGGLGPEFESIIVNLTSRESLTLQEVQYLLQTYEMKLENLSASAMLDISNSTAANMVHKESQSVFSGHLGFQYNNRGRNFNLGRVRSYSQTGSNNTPQQFGGDKAYQQFGRFGKPMCQICGKAGHIALKCYHRFDLSYQTTFASASHVFHNDSSESREAYVASPHTVQDEAWYLDSGATHHVTANGELLVSKSEYSGTGTLTIGDGSKLPISHIGTATLPSPKSLALKNILLVSSIAKNLISISKFTRDNNVIVEFSLKGPVEATEEASRYEYSSSSNHLLSLSNDLQQTCNRKSLSLVSSHVSHCVSCV